MWWRCENHSRKGSVCVVSRAFSVSFLLGLSKSLFGVIRQLLRAESQLPGCWAHLASASPVRRRPSDGIRQRSRRTSGPWSLALWSRWRQRIRAAAQWRWWRRRGRTAPVKADKSKSNYFTGFSSAIVGMKNGVIHRCDLMRTLKTSNKTF